MVTRSPVNPVQKSYESVPSVKHLSRTDTELTSPRKEVTANCYDCFFGFVFLCMRVRISLFVCIIYLISPVSETVGSSMFNLSVLIPSIVNKLFSFSHFNLILKIFIIIHHTWLIAHDIIGLHDNMGNVYILKFIHGAFSPLFLKKSQVFIPVHTKPKWTSLQQINYFGIIIVRGGPMFLACPWIYIPRNLFTRTIICFIFIKIIPIVYQRNYVSMSQKIFAYP